LTTSFSFGAIYCRLHLKKEETMTLKFVAPIPWQNR
jgi:hypothetical protein